MHSLPTFKIFSLKSTPIVASVLVGNFPAQARTVKQVFPTFVSPETKYKKCYFGQYLSWFDSYNRPCI